MRVVGLPTRCLLLVACGSSMPASLLTDQVVSAHRGASGHAPEHTIAAYDVAIEMGTEYIEQDVLPTEDDIFVCVSRPRVIIATA